MKLSAALGLWVWAAATPGFAQVLLEVPEGPVVNSNRVMAMGGAFVGVAEGADGHLINPASFAYRYPHTRNQFVDWDWTLYSLRLPGSRNPDLYGRADETRSAVWSGAGIDLKLGPFGFGAHVRSQQYELDVGTESQVRVVENRSVGLGLAYSLPRPDVTFGAYAYGFLWRVASVDGVNESPGLSALSGGGRVGLLWAPRHRPVRVGIVYRTPLTATDVQVDDPAVFDRPDGVTQAGQLSIGGSFMVGERRYNPDQTWGLQRFRDARGKAEGAGRRYLRISYDLLLPAASAPGAVSMRSYFQNPDAPTAVIPTSPAGFRGGLESEVWANWLVLRSGYYFEPRRVELVRRGRHHVTGGFAFRLPVGGLVGFWPWDLRLEAAVDVAREYLNAGLGLGLWH